MAVLDELGTYLDVQAVVVRAGAARTLYEGALPDDAPDPVMALFLSGSWQMPEHDLGGETTRVEYPTVQMMVRGSDFATTRTLIKDGYAALVKIGGRETLSGIAYLAVEAQQQPFVLDRDLNLRWRWVCNFRISKAAS